MCCNIIFVCLFVVTLRIYLFSLINYLSKIKIMVNVVNYNIMWVHYSRARNDLYSEDFDVLVLNIICSVLR